MDTSAALNHCITQIRKTIAGLPEGRFDQTPRSIRTGGSSWELRPVSREEWTCGFWPGILWYAYGWTGDEGLRRLADSYTAAFAGLADLPALDHDLGFILFCSCGNGYRQTGDPKYRELVLKGAERMKELFHPAAGTFAAWPARVEELGGHNSIVDTLGNLEILFWASEQTGDPEYARMAVSHADRSMVHQFREDGSCHHIVVYDPESGKFLRAFTGQGWSDSSMWARGQAWAIYGYTLCYRFTHEQRYLDFACKVADIYLRRLPGDKVPYWDFDCPEIPDTPRDSSAAAIAASALVELSGWVGGEKGGGYRDEAIHMLESLHTSYLGKDPCPSLLVHATGNRPKGIEVDSSMIYADHYYMEALVRLAAAGR